MIYGGILAIQGIDVNREISVILLVQGDPFRNLSHNVGKGQVF